MRRAGWIASGAAGLVTVAAAGGAVAITGAQEATPAAHATQPPAGTATVERGALAAVLSLDGTLTRAARPDGSPYAVVNRASGTYTELPAVGERIGCGGALYRVDDRPVLLLCGAIPAYRALRDGDAGRDVRQLNRNLRKLGYDADPGDDFTWKTRQALEQLQRDTGLEATGRLAVGDALFLPGAIRISQVTAELGGAARPGAQVARGTSETPVAQVQLALSQQGTVKAGDRARIALPGGRSATGRVERLGPVVRTPDDQGAGTGVATIPAFVALDRPARARGLDGAPVQVEIATAGVRGVLSVPLLALLGSSGGGFAVEVVRAGGRRELVAVRLGLVDSTAGRVEVDGALDAGDRIVVPAL